MENTKSKYSIREFLTSLFGTTEEDINKVVLGEDLDKSLKEIEANGEKFEENQSGDNKIAKGKTTAAKAAKIKQNPNPVMHVQSHEEIDADEREV